MPTLTRATLSCLALAASAFLGTRLASQTQSTRVPQFENDATSVWRSTILPHQPLSLHRHDHPRVLVALTGGTLNFIDSTGATQSLTLQAGSAYYLPAMPPGAMHSDVNPGTQPIEVMMIELKRER